MRAWARWPLSVTPLASWRRKKGLPPLSRYSRSPAEADTLPVSSLGRATAQWGEFDAVALMLPPGRSQGSGQPWRQLGRAVTQGEKDGAARRTGEQMAQQLQRPRIQPLHVVEDEHAGASAARAESRPRTARYER